MENIKEKKQLPTNIKLILIYFLLGTLLYLTAIVFSSYFIVDYVSDDFRKITPTSKFFYEYSGVINELILIFSPLGYVYEVLYNLPESIITNLNIFIIALIISILLGVLYLFIVIGLLKGKKWSRNFAIVLSILNVLVAVPSLIRTPFLIVVYVTEPKQLSLIFLILLGLWLNLMIVIYLLYNKKIKAYFYN